MEENEWMEVEEYSYLWKEEKVNHVLVKSSLGYSIIDKKHHTMLVVEDDELEKKLIEKMLENGNKIYEDINQAYKDV